MDRDRYPLLPGEIDDGEHLVVGREDALTSGWSFIPLNPHIFTASLTRDSAPLSCGFGHTYPTNLFGWFLTALRTSWLSGAKSTAFSTSAASIFARSSSAVQETFAQLPKRPTCAWASMTLV